MRDTFLQRHQYICQFQEKAMNLKSFYKACDQAPQQNEGEDHTTIFSDRQIISV